MKAPRITAKDQYVQDIKLNRGTYTYSAWVFAMGSNYSIGLKNQSGTWLNFDMATQIKALEWRKVKLTFTIYDPCVQFSLMNSHASSSAYVIVAAPMLEEGTNAGTHKPNDLDLDESIGDGSITLLLSNESHVFKAYGNSADYDSTRSDIIAYKNGEKITPSSITVSNLPLYGMSVNIFSDYVIISVSPGLFPLSGTITINVTVDGITYPLIFSYSVPLDGVSKGIYLNASTQIIRKLKNGTWTPSVPVTVTGTTIGTEITIWEYSVNGGAFSTTLPTGVNRVNNVVSINPNAAIAYALYTIRASDGTISDTLSVARIEDGTDGDTALTLLLSNESHTFAGSATAALPGSVNTAILAFKGSQQITPTSVSVGDLPTGMTAIVNGSVITFNVTSSLTTSGVVSISVVIDGKTFTLQFSYSIAFKGTDGLSKGIYLNAATQVVKYNEAGTPTPSSNFTVVGTAVNTTITTWQYSINGGSFTSTLPAGVTRSGNTVTISPTTVTFNTLSIRASDGTISDTITIAAVRDGGNGLPGKMPILMDWVQGDMHYNNGTVVSYVYYRTGNTWWRLKDAYTERVATASPSTTYYQQLSSVEYLVTKIIIAEQGNLAGLIFKDNMLISQKGMINGVASTDYGNPGFEPYVYIDGNNGEIKANKLLNPFVVADPDIPGDLQAKLTNNHNIYLESSGIITYDWKEHTLPGNGTLSDRALDGLNLKIYAPYGCNRRIRIKPAHADARIFTDDPGNVISAIKIGHDIRERIHLSAVWDRAFEVLDWVITSRTSYRVKNNQDDPSEIRVPNVFKEGDIIAKGNVYDSAGFSDLLNRYGQNIFCSVSSGRYTLSIPRDGYYNAEGTMISRTISADQFELQVTPGSTIYRNTYVYKTYGTVNGITGVHFYIEFRTYNGSTPTATPFRFILRASGYVFNNQYLDDTL